MSRSGARFVMTGAFKLVALRLVAFAGLGEGVEDRVAPKESDEVGV